MYPEYPRQFVLKVGDIRTFNVDEQEPDEERTERVKRDRPQSSWRSCFRTFDGTIYLPGGNLTTDGGRTIVKHSNARLADISITDSHWHRSMAGGPEGDMYSRPGLFVSLDGRALIKAPGVFEAVMWRSTDDLQTVEEGKAIIRIPGGPSMLARRHIWADMYIARDMVALPDGTLLATGYGAFESDRISPSTATGRAETRYLVRSFVISSKDEGTTWDYLSTIAYTCEGDPVEEGPNEPTMTLLDNGDLFCIMRTGHHSALLSSRSSDGGKTWSDATYTGLDRGRWPCLRTLADGRLVVSYGNRYPAGWSRLSDVPDHVRLQYPGAGIVKLAISQDGRGETWEQTTIASGMGSCYSTMFEVEPNILFLQVDSWYWRVMLEPRIPDDL